MRVVVADVGSGAETFRNVLGDDAAIIAAETVDQAFAELEASAELIACGIHFDDSRMFDFLRLVRADPRFRETPFICFRDLRSGLPPAILESLDISSRALGADCFVDLYDWKRRFGTKEADRRFRAMLLSLARRSNAPEPPGQ